MRKSATIFAICASLAALSCSKADSVQPLPDNAITVSACIATAAPLDVSTKADDPVTPYTAYQNTTPSTTMPLYAAVWASSRSHRYQGAQRSSGSVEYHENGYVDYHNTTKFTSGAKQLLDYQLYYPDANATGFTDGTDTDTTPASKTALANSPVYFIGLCPRSESGWTVESSEGYEYNLAKHTFDGKEDVMFAPEVSKNITQTDKNAKLTFNHMLTWLCIKMKAETEKDIETWGKVKSVKIGSKNHISINTVDGTATFTETSEGYKLPTYKVTDGKYTADEFAFTDNDGVDLTTTATELCYVLCAPVDASAADSQNEYTLTVEIGSLTGTTAKTVPINLKAEGGTNNFSGSTAGKQFSVVLTFKTGNNISTIAEVESWTNGGLALTTISED